MIFRTEVAFPDFRSKIQKGDRVILLGSCFSSEMEPYFSKIGLKTLSNPFGVIFHPLIIARILGEAISELSEVELVKRGELYFSWGSSGEIYSDSEDRLIRLVNEKRELLRDSLRDPNAKLFLTFGTSYGYKLVENHQMVANCHKQPGTMFQKELSEISEMYAVFKQLWLDLKDFNPSIEVYTSVSPVRHIKDGIRNNNISKSRLLELTSQMESLGVEYIPAYELILDELRDYRFFEADLIHPNRIAKDFLWEKMSEVLLDKNDIEAFRKVADYHTQFAHRTLYPESEEEKQRLVRLKEQREELIRNYPEMQIK